MIRFALLLFLTACGATSRPPLTAQDYPGTLVSSELVGTSFMARQEITATFGEHTNSFSAIVQSHDGLITVVGLTPFGSRAFVITQRRMELEYQSYIDQELPFPPRFMLLDIHRALFIALPNAPLPDGEHSIERDGEQVTELWSGGVLQRRVFSRADMAQRGQIVISYQGTGTPVPERIQLENQWFGYRLDIVTSEMQQL